MMISNLFFDTYIPLQIYNIIISHYKTYIVCLLKFVDTQQVTWYIYTADIKCFVCVVI